MKISFQLSPKTLTQLHSTIPNGQTTPTHSRQPDTASTTFDATKLFAAESTPIARTNEANSTNSMSSYPDDLNEELIIPVSKKHNRYKKPNGHTYNGKGSHTFTCKKCWGQFVADTWRKHNCTNRVIKHIVGYYYGGDHIGWR